MTCVLNSPFHVVGNGYDSSVMSGYQGMQMGPGVGGGMMDASSSSSAQQQQQQQQQHPQHHEYASSVESSEEPRRASSGSTKKRPSRAGTRSVSTLSAAQLERKRANDREAQRAIRQRTKDHISTLEQEKSDLQAARESSDQMLAVTRQRVRELEDENSYLRSRLTEAGYPPAAVSHRLDNSRLSDPAVVPVEASPTQPTSASSLGRADSTAMSVATSQSSSSRHGSWPQQQSSQTQQTTPFVGPGAAAAATGASTIPVGANLTQWTSHDSSAHSMHSHSQASPHQQIHEPGVVAGGSAYGGAAAAAATPTERSPWPTPQQQQQQQQSQGFAYQQDQQRGSQQFSSTPYATGAQQGGPGSGGPPPQAEFSALHVSSPTAYQIPGASAGSTYNIGPLGISTETPSDYAAAAAAVAVQQGQMQPPPLPGAGLHFHQSASGGPQQFAQQQQQPQHHHHHQQQQQQHPQHQQMQFRDPSGNRTYALPHYSSG